MKVKKLLRFTIDTEGRKRQIVEETERLRGKSILGRAIEGQAETKRDRN
jgi:hypothetical protein